MRPESKYMPFLFLNKKVPSPFEEKLNLTKKRNKEAAASFLAHI